MTDDAEPPQPTLGIAVPTYRPAPGHLDELLRSLAEQRHPVDAVVITDDSPDDGAAEVVARWSDRLPLRYLPNQRRLGITANWNAAVRACDADVVVLPGQDDAYEPGFTDTVLAVLRSHPEVVAVGVGRRIVDGDGRPWPHAERVNDRSHIWSPGSLTVLDTPQLAYLMVRNGNAFGEPSCVAYRRRAWEEIGGYDESLRQVMDVEFDLRLSEVGPVAYLAEPLVRRRRHAGAATAANRVAGTIASERHEIYRRWLGAAADGGDVGDLRAAHLSYLGFDMALAARRCDWPTLRTAAADARDTGWPGLRPLVGRAAELVRRTNRDAR